MCFCALLCAALCNESATAAEQPSILFFGDSITIGQFQFLPELLPEYAVAIQPGNGRDTAYRLAHLDELCHRRRWDVIYLNAGLHDALYTDPPEPYASNLRTLIASLLTQYTDHVVWGRITQTDYTSTHRRSDERIQAFNAAADAVVAEFDLPVVDLYAATPIEEITDGTHFTDDGYYVLAELTAATVRHVAQNLHPPAHVPIGPWAPSAVAGLLVALALRAITCNRPPRSRRAHRKA